MKNSAPNCGASDLHDRMAGILDLFDCIRAAYAAANPKTPHTFALNRPGPVVADALDCQAWTCL